MQSKRNIESQPLRRSHEPWQGSNTFRVALGGFKHKIQGSLATKRDKVKPGEVTKRHRNEYGTLLLLEDLFNYKAKLAGVACMPTGAEESLAASWEIASPSSDDAEAIEGIVLESCVEWSTVEQKPSNSVQPA
jgi:hypothetical protein